MPAERATMRHMREVPAQQDTTNSCPYHCLGWGATIKRENYSATIKMWPQQKSLRSAIIDTIISSLPAAASHFDCRYRSHPDCRATLGCRSSPT